MQPMYEFSVPVFRKMLKTALNLLDKAEAHVKANGGTEADLLEARLAPDMFPFVKQVQIVCDNAKGASSRLAGVENPSHPDTETSIAELKARVEKTLAFLDTLKEEQFADAADRKIVLPYYPDKHLLGMDYLQSQALQNFFFHVSMMYAILRMKGVQIGKADYIVDVPWQAGA